MTKKGAERERWEGSVTAKTVDTHSFFFISVFVFEGAQQKGEGQREITER